MRSRTLPIALALFVGALQAEPPNAAYISRGERCWADVRVLADDAMEGRRAGMPGHRRAAEYVAEQFRRAHLEPGGEAGFFQPVRLQARQIVEDRSSLALVREGRLQNLALGDDAILGLRGNFASSVDAPLVFAGYGLHLPQFGVDDLAGLDLKGKIVVAFVAAPANVPGTAGAHFGSPAERWKVYHARGAVGFVLIPNPFSMDLPWERVALARLEPYMVLADPAEDQFPGQRLWVQLNPTRLEVLLSGTKHRAPELLARLKAGEPLPRFELPARIRARITARISDVTSENVVGVLRGSDPKLAAEQVVLSAHLDHLGIGSEGSGDRLFNGAMDNASGVAVLIDIARQLDARQQRGRRSIVFLAVTAEEVGLLGSRSFVSRSARVMANLNTDMFLPLFPMQQLTVFGLDESDLGEDARAVAASLGVAIQQDPQPLRNRFIRSDQYSFIRAGIPALAMKVGFGADSSEAEIERRWFSERYHAPTDAPDQPVDLGAVGLYAELVERLALRVADRVRAPRWNPTSPFAKPEQQVLFVCEHGNVKSLMAASYFTRLARERGLPFRGVSRGTAPDSTTVPAPIVAGLRQDGFDVSDFRPAAVDAAAVSAARRVILIGTALPEASERDVPVEQWNDVPAASKDYAAARASLEAHVERLVEQLSEAQSR
jgi:protein-tyrosine-phosphatase